MRRDVEFRAEDGTVLRGFLHGNPEATAPGIVMAHGFSGVKEQIDHYAVFFAANGFTVLVYDHRGFGASDGRPRLEVDPATQLADWRDAITFAETQHGLVGPGIWGSSFAGGLALVLAANDRRVRCVVAQIPPVSGHANGTGTFNVEQRQRLGEAFGADRTARLSGATPAMITVFSTDPTELCALPPAVSANYLRAVAAAAPSWSNEVTLRSVERSLEFESAGWVPHISPTPLLMIVGTHDACTFPDLQLDAYTTAREPKRLVLHPGAHFDTYTTHFAQTSQAALDWYREHLC